MTRVTLTQTNFTAGELSPKLIGRVDIDRYPNAAKSIENGYPVVHGGVVRRNGLRYVTSSKHADKKARLVPYIFNEEQAYILEFGDSYMRVYVNGAQVLNSDNDPYEIETLYTEAMLDDIDYVQSADTMIIAHQAIPLSRLRRYEHAQWTLSTFPFITEPFAEIGYRPQNIITVYEAPLVPGTWFGECTDDVFLSSDLGRDIIAGTGVAKIIEVMTLKKVALQIINPFTDLVTIDYSPDEWMISGSPQGSVKPSAKEFVGSTITLESVASDIDVLEEEKIVTGMIVIFPAYIIITVISHGYSVGDFILFYDFLPGSSPANGTYKITVINDANNFSYKPSGNPYGAAFGKVRRVKKETVAQDIFRPSDAGKYVKINGGIVKLTIFSNEKKFFGEIIKALAADIAAVPNAWTLESSIWNNVDGYPRAVAFYEQRLIAAGSTAYPQTVWMSRTGNYLDWLMGTNDDDAISFTIASEQINPIQHLNTLRALVALTYGGEFTLTGGVEKPITPTNIQVKNQSVYGCNKVKPVRVGNELLFMQRASRKFRAMAYKFDSDAYGSPDLSILADHITDTGIIAVSYQQEPNSLMYLVRADGVLATVTLDRDQDVIGWARQITDGAIESVASIPVDGADQTWVIVRRTVNDETVRYVERFDSTILLDAAITGTDDIGASTWSGLDYLEGKEVQVLADGCVMSPAIVADGEITLSRPAKSVVIGLPYTTTIDLLTPELVTATGSAQGNSMRISELTLRFLNTVGCEINGAQLPFKRLGGAILDAQPEPYTGDIRYEKLGWERGTAEVTIQQKLPLPFYLLAVIKKFTSND